MIQIRPISDLRNKFTEIVETALDEADQAATEENSRYTHEEVFSRIRRRVND